MESKPASLEEQEDFGRFHVEVSGLDGDALRRHLARHRLGRVAADDHVDVRVSVVESLATAPSPAWAQKFAAMLAYARSHGWMPDEDHIRAHCVRVD
jgi:hypothetical protein